MGHIVIENKEGRRSIIQSGKTRSGSTASKSTEVLVCKQGSHYAAQRYDNVMMISCVVMNIMYE